MTDRQIVIYDSRKSDAGRAASEFPGHSAVGFNLKLREIRDRTQE